jgi:hypothetical protein
MFCGGCAPYVNIFVRKYNENFLFFVYSFATLRRAKIQDSCSGNPLMVKLFDFLLKFLVKIFNKNS